MVTHLPADMPMTARILASLFCLMLLSSCALSTPMRSDSHTTFPAVAYQTQHPNQVADLHVPEGPGPHPAMLLIHGGGWTRGERADMDKFVERLLRAGYAVANIGYRFAPQHRFPAQVEDVAAAHRWLEREAQRWNIDPARMGVMGYSAGGHLALMLGLDETTTTHRLKAIVSGAGPADVTVYTQSPYLERLIGPYEDHREIYRQASPLFLASPDDPPTLLYHGRWDALVEVEQSQRMARALAAQGVPHQLIEVPFSGHVTNYLFDRSAWGQVQAFLDQHVGQFSPPPAALAATAR